ncbi:flagellar basal body rod protein FlgC [Marinivivus vitaminiproducens]|uniref:flagellar basal body rod protein FlgC n=1 Tax=Marinivivus vitaminiproducens TaxID=3035935 RepID=UPI0027A566CC|nr:flagellar basal body rod protein FlgC [Geminicoccaceae bacterium SCSIO 64248]
MTDPFTTALGTSASAMRAQGTRIRIVTENIANADTPGFQRKQLSFEASGDTRKPGVDIKRIFADDAPLRQSYEPGHPLADANGYVLSSNVNPLIELADFRQAQRSYEASTSMFEQARSLYQRTIDLLRR